MFRNKRERSGGAIVASDLIREDVDFNCNNNRRGVPVGIIRKQSNQEHLFFAVFSINCVGLGRKFRWNCWNPGFIMSLQRDLIVISFLDLALPVGESFEGKGVFFTAITRKLLIYGFLLMINSISFVFEAVWKGTQACYICGFGRGFSS